MLIIIISYLVRTSDMQHPASTKTNNLVDNLTKINIVIDHYLLFELCLNCQSDPWK